MKKTCAPSRSKPPAVRSSYLCGKLRGHLSVERHPTPPGIDSTSRLLSMSENPEGSENTNIMLPLKGSSKEVTDCMSGWLSYVEMLKGLCCAGAHLSHCLGALTGPTTACHARALQCRAMWDHLSSATNAAASVVKSQALANLQEVHTGPDIDVDQLDINQQMVCSGLITMVNLQYQLSLVCCESLGGLGDCPCSPPHTDIDTHSVSRCYTRTSLPLLPQRRWSEACAGMEGRVPDSARRWSMPWKLSIPTGPGSDRSRSTTPDAAWHSALTNQDDIQDAISIITLRSNNQGHHLPGVTLTRAVEPVASRCSSHRGSWWGEGEEPDVGMLASRKSSSSTDCSSCYSLHSRTSTSGSDELTYGQRSHLYSMWSGSDLPFIKLPESSENPDT